MRLSPLAAAIVLGLGSPGWGGGDAQRAVVLGVAQDGGFPHVGCTQDACVRARREPKRRGRVACLGLVDDGEDRRFLIDATPDLASQIESLNRGRAGVNRRKPLDGILLTHAHIGHYSGLMYLGREALGADHVPVYGTRRMLEFLTKNGPWSQLVALGNIELRELTPGREVRLTASLAVTPMLVPHRDEFTDTVGYKVVGPRGTLLYIPDIDKWETWDRRLAAELADVSVALVDGTFERADEVPGRSQREIPHPLVPETIAQAPPTLRSRLRFIHLNHTNRLLWDGKARRALERDGSGVARDGAEFPL